MNSQPIQQAFGTKWWFFEATVVNSLSQLIKLVSGSPAFVLAVYFGGPRDEVEPIWISGAFWVATKIFPTQRSLTATFKAHCGK